MRAQHAHPPKGQRTTRAESLRHQYSGSGATFGGSGGAVLSARCIGELRMTSAGNGPGAERYAARAISTGGLLKRYQWTILPLAGIAAGLCWWFAFDPRSTRRPQAVHAVAVSAAKVAVADVPIS